MSCGIVERLLALRTLHVHRPRHSLGKHTRAAGLDDFERTDRQVLCHQSLDVILVELD